MKNLVSTMLAMLVSGVSTVYSQTGWTIQNSGTTRSLYSVKAVSQTVAWTGGEEGVVLRTTTGGSTWSNVGISAPDGAVVAIDALDQNTALFSLVTHTSTSIHRTTNGGVSWVSVFSQPGGFIDGIRMVDANTGFAMGDPVGGKWTILRTTDRGASWFRIATEPTQIGGEIGWQNSFHVVGHYCPTIK